MDFSIWKGQQFDLGNLKLSNLKKERKVANPLTRTYPYATIGWVKKYQRLGAGRDTNKLITVDDYLRKAFEAGLTSPEQIGRDTNDYQLGRYGDDGDYTVDNCRFITKAQNIAEQVSNGGFKHLSKGTMTGKKHSEETKIKMSKAALKWRNR